MPAILQSWVGNISMCDEYEYTHVHIYIEHQIHMLLCNVHFRLNYEFSRIGVPIRSSLVAHNDKDQLQKSKESRHYNQQQSGGPAIWTDQEIKREESYGFKYMPVPALQQ